MTRMCGKDVVEVDVVVAIGDWDELLSIVLEIKIETQNSKRLTSS